MSGQGGSVRKRSDGRWEGRYRGVDGRQRAVYAETKAEAQRALRKALDLVDAGRRPVDNQTTVGQYLERWLESAVRPRCKPTTAASYAETVRRYITPHLGSIKLAKLRPEDIRMMLASLGRTNLSPTTVRYSYSVLRIALGRAYKDEVIPSNVAEKVEPPAKARTTIEPLSLDELGTFLRAIEDHRLGALFATAIYTGMRQGELLGLRWDDVDLDRGVVRVRHTLERGTRTLAEPKTAGSVRNVRLDEATRAILRAWSARQKRERLAAGADWFDTGLVFTTAKGRALDGINVTHDLQDALSRAGLRRQRFHDLRHLFATLALGDGVPITDISRSLGHASNRTTMDVYGHIGDDRLQVVADRVGAVIEAAKARASG